MTSIIISTIKKQGQHSQNHLKEGYAKLIQSIFIDCIINGKVDAQGKQLGFP